MYAFAKMKARTFKKKEYKYTILLSYAAIPKL